MDTTVTKSRDGRVNGSAVRTDYNPNGSISSTTNVVPFTVKTSGELESITQRVHSSFKKRVSSGEVMMGPVAQITDRRTSHASSMTFGPHPVWGMRVISGDVAAWGAAKALRPEHPAMGDKIVSVRDLVLTKVFAKVAPSEADIIVSLAEAKKTAQMLRNPFQKSLDLVTDMVGFRQRLLKKGMNYANATVQAYLEFRFGFMPTIYDIQNLAKAVRAKPKTSKRLVARSSTELFDVSQRLDPGCSFPGLTGLEMKCIDAWRHRVSAGVLYELTETSDDETLRNFGGRLSDVPRAMYELVPFSFVLDRFYSVGPWLTAMTPRLGVDVKGSWLTTIDSNVTDFSVVSARITVNTAPATTYVQTGGSYREEISSKVREVNVSVPSLPPTNVGDLSITQIIDHAALISQVLGTFDVKQLRRWETYAPKKRWVSLYRRHPTL